MQGDAPDARAHPNPSGRPRERDGHDPRFHESVQLAAGQARTPDVALLHRDPRPGQHVVEDDVALVGAKGRSAARVLQLHQPGAGAGRHGPGRVGDHDASAVRAHVDRPVEPADIDPAGLDPHDQLRALRHQDSRADRARDVETGAARREL